MINLPERNYISVTHIFKKQNAIYCLTTPICLWTRREGENKLFPHKESKLLSKIQVILLCLHNTYDMGRELWSIRSVSKQLHLVFQKMMDLLLQSSNILLYASGFCYASSYPPDISRVLCQILQMLSTKNNHWHLQVACTNNIQNRIFYIHLFVLYILCKPWLWLLKKTHSVKYTP